MLPHASGASAIRAPTTRDIPPVTLTNIPNVDPSAFKSYLSQVGGLYDSLQRARAEAEKVPLQAGQGSGQVPKKDDFAESLDRSLRREQQSALAASRSNSFVGGSPVESPQPKRRSSGGLTKRGIQATPLSTIPAIYFDEAFRLENPRTFDVVSERSEVVRPTIMASDQSKDEDGYGNGAPVQGRKALATNAILQEKLSWYMDTVEVHLISAISTASSRFFAALGSLRELQAEAAESVTKIKGLREDLAVLDREMAIGGLKVIDMKRRRQSLRKLFNATEQLASLINGVSHCEELIDRGELDDALDRLDVLDRIMLGTQDPREAEGLHWLDPKLPDDLIDLRGLRALDRVADGMQQLRLRIGRGYEARFLEALLGDLREHIKTVPHQETLQRWASTFARRGELQRSASSQPSYLKTNSELRATLKGCLYGLSRSRYTAPAAASLREAVLKEMKGIIRQNLPSSTDDDTESMASISTNRSRMMSQQEKSSILARNLRSLGPDDAEELFVKMYCSTGEVLRRLGVQVKVLLDITSGVASPPTSAVPRSPQKSPSATNLGEFLDRHPRDVRVQEIQAELVQALDMSSLVGQAVDVAQSQTTKVLKVRSEQAPRLDLQHFLRYFHLNRFFAEECEAVSGRSGAALKGVVNTQITEFISAMGDAERQRLAQVMDADRWEAKDFGDAENVVLSRILEGATKDPPTWLRSTRIWEDPADTPAANGAATAPNGTGKEKARTAKIEEESFIVVESTLATLRGIERFLNLMAAIPSITPDVSAALVDYLKLFNSRSCQLILGAGATRSAGLRNINTKHLALASQSLGLVVALVPHLREFVRRHAPPTFPQLADYDRARRLYQDHEASIQDKLVEIMSGRATAHAASMRRLDFDDPATAAQQASAHMETLTKETATLHRVLVKNMPQAAVAAIMAQVFRSYREQWGEAFEAAAVRTAEGKKRWVSLPGARAHFFLADALMTLGSCATPNCSTPGSARSTVRQGSATTSRGL